MLCISWQQRSIRTAVLVRPAASRLSLRTGLVGRVGQSQQGSDVRLNERRRTHPTSVQDAWKATSQADVVTTGLRWEPLFPLTQRRKPCGFIFVIRSRFSAKNQRRQVYVNAPAGLIFPGDEASPGTASSKRQHEGKCVVPRRVGVVYYARGAVSASDRRALLRLFTTSRRCSITSAARACRHGDRSSR